MIISSPNLDLLQDRIQITHADGIHIRPAHAILVLAHDVNKELGIKIYIGKPTREVEWRDIILENELAKNGFGLQYAAFLELALVAGSTIAVKYMGSSSKTKLEGVSRLLHTLLEDGDALENGGKVEYYAPKYLTPLKLLSVKS